MDESKSGELITYLHHLTGGPADGQIIPSMHHYERFMWDDAVYVRRDDEAPLCEPPAGLEVLHCTDEIAEDVFRKVVMDFSPRSRRRYDR